MFTSFGAETGRRYTTEEITAALSALENEEKKYSLEHRCFQQFQWNKTNQSLPFMYFSIMNKCFILSKTILLSLCDNYSNGHFKINKIEKECKSSK